MLLLCCSLAPVRAQIPETQYTTIAPFYYTGQAIACTARVYSNGLIDQLCAIYYRIYKDDFTTPIATVTPYGTIEYTVRSQGTNYITQSITNGQGNLSVKPLFSTYIAFTLGIFDNYCVERNRPVAIDMILNQPGVYRFTADIQSCSNSGSSIFTSFTANGAPGCGTDSHTDYASSSCSNPTTLVSNSADFIICLKDSISFAGGTTELCPGDPLSLSYAVTDPVTSVDTSAFPSWVHYSLNTATNTVSLTGTAPAPGPIADTLVFQVPAIIGINPTACPRATINQTIIIKDSPVSEFYESGLPYTWNTQTYETIGDYVQTFTAANGCDSVVTLHLGTTGIGGNDEPLRSTLVPNPARDYIDLTIVKDREAKEVLICNALGHVLYRQAVYGPEARIALEKFTPGVYFLLIRRESEAPEVIRFICE